MGLDDKGLKFEGVEVLFDLFVAGFGLEMDGWDGAGHGHFAAFALFAGHEAFDVFGLGGLDAIAAGCDEEDAGVAQGDGPVTVVGDDEADGHDSVGDVVDAKEGHFVFGVVGFGGDGELFVGVYFDGGEVAGGLDRRRGVVAGERRQGQEGRGDKAKNHRTGGYGTGEHICHAQLHRKRLYQDGRQKVVKE